MAAPDINYLNQLAEFFVTYGPWAVAIIEGLYILKIQRDYRKDREIMEAKRSEERRKMLERHEEFHEEIVSLVKDSTTSKAVIAGRMLSGTFEIKTMRKALEQYLNLITEGIVKIKPAVPEEDVEEVLKDLIDTDEPNVNFKRIDKKVKEDLKEN